MTTQAQMTKNLFRNWKDIDKRVKYLRARKMIAKVELENGHVVAIENVTRVELHNGYTVVIENDHENKKTRLGVEGWQLMFTTKQQVVDHIASLNAALVFWEYD